MFRPDNNHDRTNYSEMLLPPEGFRLEKAVGTTYSLDLEALTAVAIVLGLTEETDSKLMQNPISMLNALQRVSSRIILFCEDGQIKIPSKPTALSILLEKMVVPVALPMDAKLKRYPAFHPKTWTLEYVNDTGEKKYRFVVMSRNLTFDRSWDISFAMDSSTKVRQKRKTAPIIDFLNYLQTQIHKTTPDATKKRASIAALKREIEAVSFSLSSKEFGEDFQILPLGIGKSSYDMSKDTLFCNDRSSADYTFHELVVMSPFLTDSVIEFFNQKDKGLTGCKRTLITRKSELSKITANKVDNFDIFAMKDEIVDGEEIVSDDSSKKQQQDIHAKIYIRKKYSDVDLYLGSMNASYAAINKNVEMMLWLGTKNQYLNGEKFLNDIFCGPEDGNANPFEKVNVIEKQEDVEADEKNQLERRIKDFCRLSKKALIIETAGKYKIQISIEGGENDESMQISPFNSNKEKSLAHFIEFEDMDVLQLSEFYKIKASIGQTSISRIIMIPTTGFPEERESAVVNSVVKDRRSFVEYISFVLGDDYLISMLEDNELGESGFFKQSTDAMPALYEKMLATALNAPERLKEIDYILKMISGNEIIPDEFRKTYEIFCRTLKLKQR